jgi:hypothetical protein
MIALPKAKAAMIMATEYKMEVRLFLSMFEDI